MKLRRPSCELSSGAARANGRTRRNAACAVFLAALAGCGAVDFLRRDPAAARDRASRFDRFADELALDLRDTAPLLERIRLGDEASSLDRAGWDETRRMAARRRLAWKALQRLDSDFDPDRLGEDREVLARVIDGDLRKLLGMASDAEIGRSPEPPASSAPESLDRSEQPGPIERLAATPWRGLLVEAPGILAAEHPARTPLQLRAWEGAIEALAEEASFLGASPSALAAVERHAYSAVVMDAVLEDMVRLQSSAGAGGIQDPLYGPFLDAARRLPGPAKEEPLRNSSSRRQLQRTLRLEFGRLIEALGEVRRRAKSRPFGGNDAPNVAVDEAWLLRMREAAGSNVDPEALADLGRTEVRRLVQAIGVAFDLNPVDPELEQAVSERLDAIRTRSVEPPGAEFPPRSPEILWESVIERIDLLVEDCPPILLASRTARTFERPHGRWSPFVRGNVATAGDPLARGSLFLEARERDPITPAWLREAEALRYGAPGRAVADAYRRSGAGERSRYWRLFTRETFEEGWGLYAVAAAAEADVLLEQDRGFGRLAQELIAFATLVADVGLNARGWTTAQASEYLTETTPLPPSAIREIVLRILSDPGRPALPAIGLLRIRSLRRGAAGFAGDSFDAAEFHAALLTGGPVPMSEVDPRIEQWLVRRARTEDG